ncbi:MAG: sigma-70 family RNA polymerase sigma factor [Armatimonadetes bacterium]|nr:sigma-70 family RNA polymerase sigma factor [Armatimonadota bacterium]
MRKNADHDDGIPSYLSRLTRAPLLTSEEEVVLTRAARRGDGQARERLIESNMRLVINIAKNYRNQTIPLEDLIQDGAIGLMHAVERFDPGRGYRFSTYATHWIRQAIGRAIDNKSKAIRLPAHISQTLRKIERMKAKVMREQGSEATADQIARELGITNKRLQMLLVASQDLLSLDMTVGEGDSTSLGSLIEDQLAANPESVVITSEVVDELHAIMNQLNDRERKVIMYRLKFVEPRDGASFRDELSQEFQVSRERIRQIEVQAIKKLRQVAQRRRLREYLS